MHTSGPRIIPKMEKEEGMRSKPTPTAVLHKEKIALVMEEVLLLEEAVKRISFSPLFFNSSSKEAYFGAASSCSIMGMLGISHFGCPAKFSDFS